jgi:hypothetical protein
MCECNAHRSVTSTRTQKILGQWDLEKVVPILLEFLFNDQRHAVVQGMHALFCSRTSVAKQSSPFGLVTSHTGSSLGHYRVGDKQRTDEIR